jgi:hypothetical protein
MQEPEKVEALDLEDLMELMRLVPWKDLGSPTLLWLNPDFGVHSTRVGGADCDLISGDRLLEIKATVTPNRRPDLRQLLGYLILARAANETDPAFSVTSCSSCGTCAIVSIYPAFVALYTKLPGGGVSLTLAERAAVPPAPHAKMCTETG